MRIIRWFRQFRAWIESVEAEREEQLIKDVMYEMTGVYEDNRRTRAEAIIRIVRYRDPKRSW